MFTYRTDWGRIGASLCSTHGEADPPGTLRKPSDRPDDAAGAAPAATEEPHIRATDEAHAAACALIEARAALAFGLADDLDSRASPCPKERDPAHHAALVERAAARARTNIPGLIANLQRIGGAGDPDGMADLNARLRELVFKSGHLLSDHQLQSIADCDGLAAEVCSACKEAIALKTDVHHCLAAISTVQAGRGMRALVDRATGQCARLVAPDEWTLPDLTNLLDRLLADGVARLPQQQRDRLRRCLDDPVAVESWRLLHRLGAQTLREGSSPADARKREEVCESAGRWYTGMRRLYQALQIAWRDPLHAPWARVWAAPGEAERAQTQIRQTLSAAFGIVSTDGGQVEQRQITESAPRRRVVRTSGAHRGAASARGGITSG